MKNLRGLFNGIIGFGIFIIMGAAGASDMDTLTFCQCIFRVIIAIIFIGIGVHGKKSFAKASFAKLNVVIKEKDETELPLEIAS